MTIETREMDAIRAFNPSELAAKVINAAKITSENATRQSIKTFEKIIKESMTGMSNLLTNSSPVDIHASKVKNMIDLSNASIDTLASKINPQQNILSDIARETTQNKVVQGIDDLQEGVVKALTYPNGLSLSSPEIIKALDALREDTDVRLDAVTAELKHVRNNTSLIETLRVAFGEYSRTLKKIWSSSADLLMENVALVDLTERDVKQQAEWFAWDRLTNGRAETSGYDDMFREKDWKEKFYDMFINPTTWMDRYRVVVPEAGVIDKAMRSVHATGILMSMIGGAAGSAGWIVTKHVAKKGVGILKSIGSMFALLAGRESTTMADEIGDFQDNRTIAQKVIDSIMGFFGGFVTSFGGIASKFKIMFLGSSRLLLGLGIVGAMVTAMIAYPEQAAAMLNVFTDLFNNQLLPTFKYIFTDILGPMMSEMSNNIMQWWHGGGESSMAAIGAFINDVLIYLFGTALPAVLNTIGTIVSSFVDTFAEIYKAITGFAGIGEYAKLTAWEKINVIINSLANFITDTLYAIFMGSAQIFSFDVDWQKGLWYNINVVINTLAEGIINVVTNIANGIIDGLTNLSQKIWDYIFDFIQKFNPATWDWGWSNDKPADGYRRVNPRQVVPMQREQKNLEEMSDTYRKFLEKGSLKDGPPIIMQQNINAPTTNTNTNSSTTIAGSGGGGAPTTSPQPKNWEKRTSSFPSAI